MLDHTNFDHFGMEEDFQDSEIFGTEVGQRLLHILLATTENTFRQACTPPQRESEGWLQARLSYISNLSDRMFTEELNTLNQRFVDLAPIHLVFVKYVKLMTTRPKNVQLLIKLPPMVNILKSYVTILSNDEYMSSCQYFKLGPLNRESICKRCCRNAFFEYIGDEYVKLGKLERQENMNNGRQIGERGTHDDSAYNSDDNSVMPDDSISNIGYEKSKRPPFKSHVLPGRYEDTVSLSSVNLSSYDIRHGATSDKRKSKGSHTRHATSSPVESKVGGDIDESNTEISKEGSDSDSVGHNEGSAERSLEGSVEGSVEGSGGDSETCSAEGRPMSRLERDRPVRNHSHIDRQRLTRRTYSSDDQSGVSNVSVHNPRPQRRSTPTKSHEHPRHYSSNKNIKNTHTHQYEKSRHDRNRYSPAHNASPSRRGERDEHGIPTPKNYHTSDIVIDDIPRNKRSSSDERLSDVSRVSVGTRMTSERT